MYIVVEIQKSSAGTIATIVNSFATRNEAESSYHTILAAAAISSVPVHSAVIMTEEGQTLMFQSYTHEEQSEEE